MELRVGGKYRLGRKIGSGSFGDIYLGELYGDRVVCHECKVESQGKKKMVRVHADGGDKLSVVVVGLIHLADYY